MPHTQELTKPSAKPKKKATATRTKAKAATKNSKRASKALATCPVNGAGWCPYPFSVEQLERRLKERAAAQAAADQSK
ncbi:MAG: hypothetical protein P4L53_24955 [Candidatus Obscuribacterales bacterium]|nr:hypothetical protein [Candidatus Obscuribacterales bacterium]